MLDKILLDCIDIIKRDDGRVIKAKPRVDLRCITEFHGVTCRGNECHGKQSQCCEATSQLLSF